LPHIKKETAHLKYG